MYCRGYFIMRSVKGKIASKGFYGKLRALTLGAILVFLVMGPLKCKPKSPSSAFAGGLEIKAQLKNKEQIKIDLKLPPNSHLYLDKGGRGNLIPVSFDWQDILKKGPQLLSAPQGEYDKEVEAKVLRGQGSFVFSFSKNRVEPQELVGKILKVRTQVCNERDGICYRPTWTRVQISSQAP